MKIYIIVHESGEYSSMDWNIQKVTPDKTAAIRYAWIQAFNNWDDEYMIEEWDIDGNESKRVTHFHLGSNNLKKAYTSSALANIENQLLQDNSSIPDILMKHVYCMQ